MRMGIYERMQAGFRRLIGISAAAAVLVCAASTLAAGPPPIERPIEFTTIVVAPLISPRPVAGADGRGHLAYELSFVNETRLLARIDSVEALDGDTGAVLAQWKGDALAAIFRINAGKPGTTLAPANSGYAFLDVALPDGAAIPKTLRHRIATTRLQPGTGADEGKGVPLDPKLNLPGSIVFEGVETEVDARPAVVVDPPLRGPGWIALNGCCDSITSHRGAIMAFNGRAAVAERFAIDFVRLDPQGRAFVGAADKVESYYGFDTPVYAVADGVVVGTSDGAPETTPGSPAQGVTIDTAAGNHVVLDIGSGNFALFAHLKPGSVAVKTGQRVKRGELLGRLGSTGNSDAPHLHFHVMDGPSPLVASGLPYAFTHFVGQGRLGDDNDAMMDGAPAKIDKNWFAGPHAGQLPLNNEVVEFADPAK